MRGWPEGFEDICVCMCMHKTQNEFLCFGNGGRVGKGNIYYMFVLGFCSRKQEIAY